MNTRFPVVAQALYDNERIEARVALNRQAIDYVLVHLKPGESYTAAVERIACDPKAPEPIRTALKENHR